MEIYEESYISPQYGNPACGDSTGSNWIEKDQACYLLDLFEGRGENKKCYDDVLFTWGKCGFSSFGSWPYSEE